MDVFLKKLVEIGKSRKIQAYCNNRCEKYDDMTKCEAPCEDIKEHFDEEAE